MTEISAAAVKALRDVTGAGMMDCKKALVEAGGDTELAVELLRKKGLASAKKRAGRSANQGVVASYIHHNAALGVLAEINCETDFVANTDEFRDLAKGIVIHIASMTPRWVTREDVPEDLVATESRIYEAQAKESGKPEKVVPKIVEGKLEAFFKENVLLDQPYVRDDSKSVGTLVGEVSGKLGEKVAIRRFVRFKLGEELGSE